MMRRLGWVLAVVLAVALLPAGVLAREKGTAATGSAGGGEMMHEHHHAKGTMDSKMEEECKARREQMMADMKAMDERLDEKVSAMNAAKGEMKSDAMAAVINELVAQRKQMRDKMANCPHAGMCGMMGKMGHEGMHKCRRDKEMSHPAPSDQGGGVKKEGAM